MRFVSLRRLGLGVSAASCVLAIAASASANGFEIPENGTEVMGRGGAWTARADSPLAAQLNPAGLAGQKQALLVNSNFTFESMCYQRSGSYGDASTEISGTVFRGQDFANQPYPEVCKKNGLANVNVVPQLAYVHPIDDRFAVAFAIVSPSGTGKAEWPDQVQTANGSMAPAPQRYQLLSKETIILYPTISAAYAVTQQLRLGVSFQAGMAPVLKFSNVSMAVQNTTNETPSNDLRADLSAKAWFVPAIIGGALYDVTDDFSIGGMFRWSADVVAKNPDVTIQGPYYGRGTGTPCTADPNAPCPTIAKATEIRVPQPFDARLGFRFHPRRKDAPVHVNSAPATDSGSARPLESSSTSSYERRDVLANDLFDAEIDLTYSHNKSVDALGITFPAGIGVALGTNRSAGYVPEDASVPHQWKDSVGVRAGLDYIVMPNQLSLRIGGFLQTSSVEPAYAGIDFLPSTMVGGYLGGTLRVSRALDLAVGFGHIFVTSVDNGNGGQVRALNAQATNNSCLSDPGSAYRSCESINSGKFTAGYTMFSLGATIRL